MGNRKLTPRGGRETGSASSKSSQPEVSRMANLPPGAVEVRRGSGRRTGTTGDVITEEDIDAEV